MDLPLFRLPLPGAVSPAEILERLPADVAPFLLEALGPGGWGSPIGGGPGGHGLLALDPAVELRGGAAALDDARRWLAERRAGEPLAALVIGCLSYELGSELSAGRVPTRSNPDAPTVRLAGFEAVYRWDAACARGEVLGGSRPAVERLAERIRAALTTPPRPPAPPRLAARVRTGDAAFARQVRRVQDFIRAGDVYQVNLARRIDAAAPADAELRALYRALAARTRAPYSAFLALGDRTVLSSSPERFLRVQDGAVETCPIKGTRPRGATPLEDEALAKELLASAKDRAEHVMIVDLERNDLGRVCATGSVRVARLAALESFSDVHHLVSSVRGRLRDPGDWPGLIRAAFPSGSISGAPKLRAQQVLAALEPVERDVYTGALGCFDAAGGVDLSIAIRTAFTAAGRLHLHLGGGIVADSDPARELAETRDKGRGFARSWGLEV